MGLPERWVDSDWLEGGVLQPVINRLLVRNRKNTVIAFPQLKFMSVTLLRLARVVSLNVVGSGSGHVKDNYLNMSLTLSPTDCAPVFTSPATFVATWVTS